MYRSIIREGSANAGGGIVQRGAHTAKHQREQGPRVSDAPLLHWTGHALVDVGIAGLCAFANCQRPEDLTLEHLDGASAFMEEHYYGGKLNAYLPCVFMNASFVQPKETPETRQAFITRYLRAHRAEPHPTVRGQACVFSGAPATSPLVRTHLPMFSGEGVLNFRPNGTTSVPVAGRYVVAIMFLPFAGLRSEGRLLAIHTDSPALTLRFARRFLENNRKLLALPLPTVRAVVHAKYDREIPSWDAPKKKYKFADAKGPRSLVVSDLTAIAREAFPSDTRPEPIALTAYLVSNAGQGPSLDIFQIPSGVIAFVVRAASAPTRKAWQAVAERFRPVSDRDAADEGPARHAKAKKGAPPPKGRAGWSRNPAFEDLCGIFDGGFTDQALAGRWLQRHVLGRFERKDGTIFRGSESRSWGLARLFLEEVLGMNKGRIEVIRCFADKLADWVNQKADKKLLHALYYGKLSALDYRLRRVQQESASGKLLFGLDEYRDVWLHEDGDRYLVRDLITIRVVERLYELGYYRTHPEDAVVHEDNDPDTAAQEDGHTEGGPVARKEPQE